MREIGPLSCNHDFESRRTSYLEFRIVVSRVSLQYFITDCFSKSDQKKNFTSVKKMVRKMKLRTYNYKIENPSPLWRKQEVLSVINENSGKVTIKRVASWLEISVADAEGIVKELANAGYVRIGKQHKCMCKPHGVKTLWITPGSNVDRFLNLSEDQSSDSSATDIKVCIEKA